MARRNMNMGNRYNQQYDSRDSHGASKAGALDFGGQSIEFFKPSEGRNKINIIPWEVSNPMHPEVASGNMQTGEGDFVLDIWVHQYLGPNKVDLLCVNKTYGKRCIVCEEKSKLYEAKKDKEAKELNASRRCYYNVQPITKDGASEKCLVMHASHFLFTKELMSEAKACTDGKGIVQFANPGDGKLVVFRGEMEKVGDGECLKFKSFQFLDRDEEIPDEVFDSAIPLDKYLVVPTLKQQEAAMWGDDEGEEETAPAGGGKSTGGSRTETTAGSGKSSASTESTPEESLSNKRGKKAEPEAVVDCPEGYTFGTDNDKQPGCSKCPDKVYDACVLQKKNLKK